MEAAASAGDPRERDRIPADRWRFSPSPNMKTAALLISLLAASGLLSAAPNTLTPQEKAAGWQLLFDGRSLDGWRASEHPATFGVKDGKLIAFGPRAHLFYVGPVQNHRFKNFELTLDVLTFPKGNSGVYFHTAWQERGWPNQGYEVQVNNSHRDPKRTAGLYNIQDNYDVVAKDGEWFTLFIKVAGKRVTTSVNGKVVADYTEPAGFTPPQNHPGRILGSGTFAIQGHDPDSQIHYRNIKVRVLPD